MLRVPICTYKKIPRSILRQKQADKKKQSKESKGQHTLPWIG